MSHYKTLGIDESATEDEIRRAYKKLAKKYHPDTNPSNPQAEETFKKVSHAYSVLSDPEKRLQYDNERKMPQGFGGFGGFPGFGGFGGGFDPFAEFMVGGRPFEVLREAGQALNIQTSLQISFLDAKQSQIQPVKFQRKTPCFKCQGTGAKEYHTAGCPTCRGRGSIVQSLGGILQTRKICQTCKGKGKLIKTKCSYCDKGSLVEMAEINVHIPAGILDGKILRLQGEGHRSINGKGDLLIKVAVTSDSRWQRDRANVHSTLLVDYPSLVLGKEIEVETIWGKEKVNIPPGTKSGTKLSLFNKGFPRLGRIADDERGIHYLTVELKLPSDNSKKHIKMLRELQTFYEQ